MDWNPDFRDLFAALNAAGARYLVIGGYAVIFYTQPRLGVVPNRIDIVMEASGVDFAASWQHRTASRYGDQDVWILDLKSLIVNKRLVGRPQDLIDLKYLMKVQ